MRKKVILLFVSFIGLIAGCSTNDTKTNELYFKNDIDQLIGWKEHQSFVKGNAHSGKYMCYVDTVNSYSYAFILPFENISNKSIKMMKASVWGKWMQGDVTLVATLISDNKSIVWNGLKFNQVTPNPNEWAKIEVYIDIPSFIPGDSKFAVYMWSQNKGIGYCDDFEIIFE